MTAAEAPTAAAASALTTRPDTRTAAMELVDGLAEQLPEAPDAVLLFGSFHHRAAFAEASTILRQALRPRHLVGVTAEWVVGRGREVEGSPGLSALALRLPGCGVEPVRFDLFDGPPNAWEEALLDARLGDASTAASDPTRGVLLFADPFSIQVPPLLDRLARRSSGAGGAGPTVIGGLASGSSQPGANVLVADDLVSATGAVGLRFSGPISVDALVSPGARPIGPALIVTKVDGNAILGLAGRPALDVLRDVAEELPENERTAIRDGLLIGSAIDEYRDRFGRGDFLLRPIVGADLKRKAVLVGDQLRPGRTVRFHVRDRTTASEDLELLLDREQMRDRPLAAFVATCGGRGRRLFGKPDADAKALARRLGDPPLAGLFAAGEIGPVGSPGSRCTRSWLHGHTVCAALFRTPAAE